MPPTTPPHTLRDLLSDQVEAWMEILFVGLSPELLSPERFPAQLATVRQGGNIPRDPMDAVFLRYDAKHSASFERSLKRAVHGLRHGGRVGIVSMPPGDDEEPELTPEQLRPLLLSTDATPTTVVAQDGSWILIGRQLDAGRQDLVGLRRCLSTLTNNVEHIESACGELRERTAGRRPLDGGLSIKELIGHLGNLDREAWFASMGSALENTTPPPFDSEALLEDQEFNERPLAELLARFRHFRSQSMTRLANLTEDDWLEVGQSPYGSSMTIAEMLRTWVREETEQLEALDLRLHKSGASAERSRSDSGEQAQTD